MPFLNAMNDYYLKNISDRIRVAMATMARDGKKISGNAPYGYRRDPEEPTRLLVDEYSAGIVRRIFDMRVRGDGTGKIAKVMNIEGVLPPLRYYLSTIGRDDSHIKQRLWQSSTLNAMLRKELYIGNAVQLVKQVVSYRDKREVKRDPEDYARVDGAFPVIIDMETWSAVQLMNSRSGERYVNKRKPEKQLFSGLLVCPDCGRRLVCIRDSKDAKRNGKKDYISYYCQSYGVTGGVGCTRHSVSENALIKIVGEHIEGMTKRVKLDGAAMLETLKSRLMAGVTVSKADKQKETRAIKQRLHRLDVLTSKFYEDRVTGVLTDEEYSRLARENEAERAEKEARLALLERTDQENAAKLSDIKRWMRLMRENANFGDLTRDLLERLVERIEVGERRVSGGVVEQDIKVVYRFIGLGACDFLGDGLMGEKVDA